jgi:hypothetical protein
MKNHWVPLTNMNRQPNRHLTQDIDDEKSLGSVDKYASMSDEDENSARLANVHNERALLKGELLKLGGLGTMQRRCTGEKDGGVKMVKNGLKKLFKKRNIAMALFYELMFYLHQDDRVEMFEHSNRPVPEFIINRVIV